MRVLVMFVSYLDGLVISKIENVKKRSVAHESKEKNAERSVADKNKEKDAQPSVADKSKLKDTKSSISDDNQRKDANLRGNDESIQRNADGIKTSERTFSMLKTKMCKLVGNLWKHGGISQFFFAFLFYKFHSYFIF